MKNKRILITGGCGAIGSTLVKKLQESNIIDIIDNLSSNNQNYHSKKNVNIYNIDISNSHELSKAISKKKYDYVFHLAANFANQNSVDNPILDANTNIIGTINLLEILKKNKPKKVIYSSSSCVYGKTKNFSEKNNNYHCDTPYAISKLSAEYYFKFYSNQHNINYIIVRYFNTFGPYELPGNYRNVIINFINSALNNKKIIITGSGKEIRDYCYSLNTVIATIKLAKIRKSNFTINIGGGKQISSLELAKKVIKFTNSRSKIEFLKRRNWDNIPYRKCNNNLSKKILGNYHLIKFDDGLVETINWIKKNLQ